MYMYYMNYNIVYSSIYCSLLYVYIDYLLCMIFSYSIEVIYLMFILLPL